MRPLLALASAALLALLSAESAGASVSVDEEEVVFRFRTAGVERVYLVGDFNGWNPTVDLLVRVDSLFEIRLYLVPGSYRYRFVADGVSAADQENPCRDAGGNSCFTLLESSGAFEIVLGIDSPAERTLGRERVETGAAVRLAARSGETVLQGDVGVAGSLNDRASMDCMVGFEARAGEERSFAGASYLVRGEAAYDLGGRRLLVFSRSAAALTEDGGAIELFGRIGPYRYPAGVMSRGVGFEGRLAAGLDARIIYANRIEEYGSGLEGLSAAGDSTAHRGLFDADALGVRVKTKAGGAYLHALYRFDKRPVVGEWQDPEGSEAVYRGYERIGMWGGRIEIPGAEGWRFDGAFMLGASDRIASTALIAPADTFASSSIERAWERGSRVVVGVSRDGDRIDARASLSRETVDELAAVGPMHTREDVLGELSYEEGSFRAHLAGAIERYGASGAGERFWLSARNFWLEDDCVALDRIPFFSSRELGEIRLSLAWKREPFEGLPWGAGTTVEILRRSGSGIYSPRSVEVRLSNGTYIHPRAALLLDMRGVSYRHDAVRGDFVAAFCGLHTVIASSAWCLVGFGVSPYAFDGRLHEYAAWGRERYLEARNPIGVLAEQDERAAVRRLLDAEEALADDWLVTLQAGFTF